MYKEISKLKNQHYAEDKILAIILQSARTSIRKKTVEEKCHQGVSLTLLAPFTPFSFLLTCLV